MRAASDDLLLASAPEAGYEQTLELTPESMGGEGSRQRSETFWYVSFANVQRYCRLRLQIQAQRDRRDHGVFGVTGFAACNPLGQRLVPVQWPGGPVGACARS